MVPRLSATFFNESSIITKGGGSGGGGCKSAIAPVFLINLFMWYNERTIMVHLRISIQNEATSVTVFHFIVPSPFVPSI